MSEYPHCPECNRMDYVEPIRGEHGAYFCEYYGCNTKFKPDDVRDEGWIDMTSRSMFRDYETTLEQANQEFDPDCECYRCEREQDSEKTAS